MSRSTCRPKPGHVLPKVLRRDTSFYMLGWTPATYDAYNVMNAIMRCVDDKGQASSTWAATATPRWTSWPSKVQAETDKNKRNAYIKEAFDLHAADVGHIPLHQQALAWGVNKKVKLVQLADNFMYLQVDQPAPDSTLFSVSLFLLTAAHEGHKPGALAALWFTDEKTGLARWLDSDVGYSFRTSPMAMVAA